MNDIEKIRKRSEEFFLVLLDELYKDYERKRHFENLIFRALEEENCVAKVVCMTQREPFTSIKIDVMFDTDLKAIGTGFSRCDGKDKWDAERGIALATHKAVRHAARQLVGLDEECSQ